MNCGPIEVPRPTDTCHRLRIIVSIRSRARARPYFRGLGAMVGEHAIEREDVGCRVLERPVSRVEGLLGGRGHEAEDGAVIVANRPIPSLTVSRVSLPR
jgi:hypothetical protein